VRQSGRKRRNHVSVIQITNLKYNGSAKDGTMLQASYLVYVLAAVYGIVGVVVVRRALKPNCRICLHRDSCPNREGDHPSEAAKSTCLGG
jgi:hypothetical protein